MSFWQSASSALSRTARCACVKSPSSVVFSLGGCRPDTSPCMLGVCMDFPDLPLIIGYAVDYLDCLGVFGWIRFFYWLCIVILSVQLFRGMQK